MNLLRKIAQALGLSQPRRSPPPRRSPLRVEPLEGRDLLATYLWVGPAGGSASAGANWEETMSSTTGVVPGTSDYALFHPALGSAILGGTLIVTAVGTLPLVNTWVIITATGGFSGDFATKTLPPNRAAGVNPGAQTNYIVT